MQELQIMLRSGQTMCVRSKGNDRVSPELGRFLDEFRVCGDRTTEKIFVFGDPLLMVRLSEVVAASLVFVKDEQKPQEIKPEPKKRIVKKTGVN